MLEHAAVARHHRVADLYAGAGNLSLPLARRAGAVIAVERTPTSVEAARENARRLGITNLELATGPTETVLRGWTKRALRLDTVVLDPPRSGARNDAVAAGARAVTDRLRVVQSGDAGA